MDYAKIGKAEAICLIIIGILNHLILNLPKSIFSTTGNGSIVNIIYISILSFVFCFLIVKFFDLLGNQDIIDISEFLGGKVLKAIIGILYIAFYVIMCSTLLRNFSESIRLTFLPNLSIFYILFAILLAVAIANLYSNHTVIKANLIITPLMILSLIITFASVSPKFVTEKMYPILGNGITETFLTGLSNFFAFTGISILYFLPPFLKDNKDFKKISYLSFAIISIILICGVACFLFGLPIVISMDELSPMYTLIKASQFGSFFERPEALFILIWILALISFLCVFSMLIIVILQKLLHAKQKKGFSLLIANIIFVVAILYTNLSQSLFMESTVYKYISLALVFIISPILLLLAYRKKKRHSKKQGGTLSNE